MITIKEAAAEKILLAAHRGVSGGNIPCNTLAAYEIALRQGADIVEIDVALSKTGGMYVFHPGMEPAHLCSAAYIQNMTDEEVRKLRFVNQDNAETVDVVSPLDDVLELLKDRAYVNVDKFWSAIPEISSAIRRHGMEQQVIIKTGAEEKWFDLVEQYAPDMPYMPLVSGCDTCTKALEKRHIHLLGAEVIFDREDAPVASPAYIEDMHRRGLLLWVNPIVYSYHAVMTAGHTDDLAMVKDPDAGWGWLIDRGFDILQTDWLLPAKLYCEQTDRRYRK